MALYSNGGSVRIKTRYGQDGLLSNTNQDGGKTRINTNFKKNLYLAVNPDDGTLTTKTKYLTRLMRLMVNKSRWGQYHIMAPIKNFRQLGVFFFF